MSFQLFLSISSMIAFLASLSRFVLNAFNQNSTCPTNPLFIFHELGTYLKNLLKPDFSPDVNHA
nr:MAG TPA: hypothetical protein [Caudoviricetes sp.]